jgi:hypothetical protein
MLDGGQDAKFVVDDDIVIRRIAFFDVVQLQFLVNVNEHGTLEGIVQSGPNQYRETRFVPTKPILGWSAARKLSNWLPRNITQIVVNDLSPAIASSSER